MPLSRNRRGPGTVASPLRRLADRQDGPISAGRRRLLRYHGHCNRLGPRVLGLRCQPGVHGAGGRDRIRRSGTQLEGTRGSWIGSPAGPGQPARIEAPTRVTPIETASRRRSPRELGLRAEPGSAPRAVAATGILRLANADGRAASTTYNDHGFHGLNSLAGYV